MTNPTYQSLTTHERTCLAYMVARNRAMHHPMWDEACQHMKELGLCRYDEERDGWVATSLGREVYYDGRIG